MAQLSQAIKSYQFRTNVITWKIVKESGTHFAQTCIINTSTGGEYKKLDFGWVQVVLGSFFGRKLEFLGQIDDWLSCTCPNMYDKHIPIN